MHSASSAPHGHAVRTRSRSSPDSSAKRSVLQEHTDYIPVVVVLAMPGAKGVLL